MPEVVIQCAGNEAQVEKIIKKVKRLYVEDGKKTYSNISNI